MLNKSHLIGTHLTHVLMIDHVYGIAYAELVRVTEAVDSFLARIDLDRTVVAADRDGPVSGIEQLSGYLARSSLAAGSQHQKQRYRQRYHYHGFDSSFHDRFSLHDQIS